MSLLSHTAFGSVYRIQTRGNNSPPNWHEVQCSVLGLADEHADDAEQNMQIDDSGEQNTVTDDEYMWIVKLMDPWHHVRRKTVSSGSKSKKRCKADTGRHRLYELGLLEPSNEEDGRTPATTSVAAASTSMTFENCELWKQEEQRIRNEIELHADVTFRHTNILPAALAWRNATGCGMLVFVDQQLMDLYDYCCGNSNSGNSSSSTTITTKPMPFTPQSHLAACQNSIGCSELTIANVCYQICSALSFLHNTFGLVHNDVKPENILVCPQTGKCYLSDFGGVSPAIAAGGYALVTASRFFVAPERVRQEAFDARADSWALGMLCCELLAHQSAHTDESSIFSNTPLHSRRFANAPKQRCGAAKRNPFDQIFTRDRWQRLMLQNFSEPLTNALWQRKLQPRDSQDAARARWFLERTLRMRAENRCTATDLLEGKQNWSRANI